MNKIEKEIIANKNKALDSIAKDYKRLDNSDKPEWMKEQIRMVYFGRIMRTQYED